MAGRRAHRLPAGVRPTTQEVHVELDPSADDRYTGEVRIGLTLDRRRNSIWLNACDLRASRARLHGGDRSLRGRVVPHPEREMLEIRFPESIPAGYARLDLAFSGRLRKDLSGLYLVEAEGRRFAFSQLAPTSARRFFPCFDEPALKARFRLAVTTRERNRVVSNSPIELEEPGEAGRKTVHFATTPPLSSYLIALAVGELESSEVHTCSGARSPTEIRVWSVPGKRHLCELALGVASECLRRLEDYFDLAYPYEKLDLVGVPDFEFGAMENPGAVFFRETLLLLDPATATLQERRRSAEVICHELAHMWYGDLVTMAWWDDLWLNEAFATWMAFDVLDGWLPEWRVWQCFQQRCEAALEVDALRHTHPVYTPVASANEAMENFDLITYEKGAAIIRMLERHVGREAFRRGVQLYIRRHRESNAVAADLWNALSQTSDVDVESIVRPWIEQAGHPVVSIRRGEREGLSVVVLRQERMAQRPAARATGGAGRKRATGARKPLRWPIPLVGRIGTGRPGDSRLVRHLLTRAREVIPAHGADLTFLYGNADEVGFLRPLHCEDGLRDLIDALPELPGIERQGLVRHQWALVRSGHARLSGLLDVIATLGADSDPDVLAAVQAPLSFLCDRLAPDVAPRAGPRLRAWVEVYFGAQIDALGLAAGSDEPADTRLRRARIVEIVGVIGEAATVVGRARDLCERYIEERHALDPDLVDPVVAIAARHGAADLHERFLATLERAETPQDQHRFLLALGDFRDPASIRRTHELCLQGEVATQDVVLLLERLLRNPAAAAPTWAFIQKRWKTLRRRIPPHLGGRLIAATPCQLTPAQRREVRTFFRAHPLPSSERSLAQALERFDEYAALRKRVGRELEAYLQG